MEVLAAMVLLAVLLPVIVHGLHLADRAASQSGRADTARRLAENQLALLIATTNISSAVSGGDFGVDWPGYRWTLDRENWSEDDMVEWTLTVSRENGDPREQISLSTLMGPEAP